MMTDGNNMKKMESLSLHLFCFCVAISLTLLEFVDDQQQNHCANDRGDNLTEE